MAESLHDSTDTLATPEVVTFPAELDISNSGQAERWLAAALAKSPSVVIADLSRTDFCDSSGLRCLILATRQAACSGIELRVVVRSPGIRRVIQVAGAREFLRLFPDMAAAFTGDCELRAEHSP